MIIKHIVTLVLIIIKSTRCSIVYDSLNQESIPMSKYCPKQKYCKEGTHVVCMYYDHNEEFGPRCRNPVKVDMTPKMIQSILANVNDMRGKVATGMEKGKHDEVLPRAYGLMKLEWDKELAFLAQVLANQCFGGREDACRSTDRFPDPSQTIAIVRYKYPDWEYIKPNDTEKGLNEEKLLFAVNRFLNSIHVLKSTLTKEMVMDCPSWHELADGDLKYYLNIIRGGATHIGCGVSAYSKYKLDKGTEPLQNSVQIVCNISDAPKPRQSVYRTVPPIPGEGYTKRCGCPRGYKETRSCLCERDKNFVWKGKGAATSNPTYNRIHPTNNMKKKKGLQLQKQIKEYSRQDSSTNINNRPHNDEDNGENNDEDNDEVMLAVQPKLPIAHGILKKKNRQTNRIRSPHIASKSRNNVVFKGKSREKYYPKEKKVDNIKSDEISKITNAIRYTHERNDPVMTFSSDPILTKEDPQDRKQVSKPVTTTNIYEDLIFKVRTYKEKATTERAASFTYVDVVKENLVGYHHDVNSKKAVYVKHQKLLSILNSLEYEVNSIKFDDDLRQLFDLKMRKIYETGVNKSQEISSPSLLDKQQNKKDLHELKTYLENNASVGNEIAILRRMIHRLSKGTQKDHKLTYAENENNSNQNYNYMNRQFKEYHETKHVNNMDASYKDVPSRTALVDHWDNHNKFNDILNSKQNVEYDDNNDRQYNTKTRNQETFTRYNARHAILSHAIDHNAKQQFERTSDSNENFESLGRRPSTFSHRTIQLSHPFNRRKEYDEMRQMHLWGPNLLGSLRISRNQPIESMYSSDRDTLMH